LGIFVNLTIYQDQTLIRIKAAVLRSCSGALNLTTVDGEWRHKMTTATKKTSGQAEAPAGLSAGIASRFPTAYSILFGLILFMAALTWFVPAGQYDRVQNEALGREVAVPGTYKAVEAAPQSLFDIFLAPVNGFYSQSAGTANAIDVSLFVLIIGGIYGGIFTATEAAAVCVVAATLIGFAQRKLTLQGLWDAVKETCIQTAAIFFIAAGAKIFVAFIALTNVAPMIVNVVAEAELSVVVLLLAIAAIYLLLGMFLDPIGIMVLTLPLMIPLVVSDDMHLIWFGVVVIKLLEIGLITPPVGLNVFVIANVVGKEAPIDKIFAGITRFLSVDVIVLVLIMSFPMISLLIPMAAR